MSTLTVENNQKQAYDADIATIANYVTNTDINSELAFTTARYCLMDSLACALMALNYPACTKLLGPVIKGTVVPNGSRVPGTDFVLDPALAAFNIGAIIRWLDFNDTWLAQEWGHPSDNLGAILACADYISQQRKQTGLSPLKMKAVLTAMIKAHEIQGILALENSFNQLGFDHVFLVKIASTAIATALLGGTNEQIHAALSHAFVDGASLRTYRHSPNTGSRKSWAAGDATSRAVTLAWRTLQGETGYPSVLSVKKWGFNDTILKGNQLVVKRKYGSYVMENILFKISFPAEFHAQTAVEAAVTLHPLIKNRFKEIDKIVVDTQESAIRIISKSGPLHNEADRDHCLQYMIAVGLIEGDLSADHYENDYAENALIDELRAKMVINENPQFSRDYLDADKRSIANAIQVFFKDGSSTDKVTVEYPIGHRFRREDGIPLLVDKFTRAVEKHYSGAKVREIIAVLSDQGKLEAMDVDVFCGMLVV